MNYTENEDSNDLINQIRQQVPATEDNMSVDMPSLLADFEVNERRVYGYNCL